MGGGGGFALLRGEQDRRRWPSMTQFSDSAHAASDQAVEVGSALAM
mgnify:CR=1 FL=1